MKLALSFDDVLLSPRFSEVVSRADVDTSITLCGRKLDLGIISSNMDTVTGVDMCKAMHKSGGVACLHRFWSIEDNVKAYLDSGVDPFVSIGLGEKELDRADALNRAGATTFVIDVAHGASQSVVNQTIALRELIGPAKYIVVGNFATGPSVRQFLDRLGTTKIDALKVNIGSGSACLTRVNTGVGLPTYTTIEECRSFGIPIISDGGVKNPGDFAKALAAGATAVMVGRLFAGTTESPGELTEYLPYQYHNGETIRVSKFKKYRGSASLESYEVQGKIADHRVYEGDSYMIPYTGPVDKVMKEMSGGIRSTMSYVNVTTIKELQQNSEFVQVTSNGLRESSSYGKDQ
jgi:IMP dehydrogenase